MDSDVDIEAENEKLRAALRRIGSEQEIDGNRIALHMVQVARRALAGDPEEPIVLGQEASDRLDEIMASPSGPLPAPPLPMPDEQPKRWAVFSGVLRVTEEEWDTALDRVMDALCGEGGEHDCIVPSLGGHLLAVGEGLPEIAEVFRVGEQVVFSQTEAKRLAALGDGKYEIGWVEEWLPRRVEEGERG